LVEVVVYLGVIGGGTQDYIGYVGMLREKAWGMMGRNDAGRAPQIADTPENSARGLAWLRLPRADATVSFACILVFTVCFVVLGATVLYPRHAVPEGFDLLTAQGSYLQDAGQSPAVRALLGFVYNTGVFFAFFGTIYGAYELYTRTARECVVAVLPRLRTVSNREFRRFTLLWCGVPGLARMALPCVFEVVGRTSSNDARRDL
jgi:hypothetical protein